MRVGLYAIPLLAMAACASPGIGKAPDADAPAAASGMLAQQNARRMEEGRWLTDVHCGECHAIGRTGTSKHPEAPALRTLSQNYPVFALKGPLAEGITVGHPDMPEYRFRPEDVSAILAYLETIQPKPHPRPGHDRN
jgi:cytochrome c